MLRLGRVCAASVSRTSSCYPQVTDNRSTDIRCLAVSGDSLFSGGNDCSVSVWDLHSRTREAVLTGHTGFVVALAVTDRNLVSASFDHTVRCWGLLSRALVFDLRHHSRCVRSLSVGTPGTYVCSGSWDGTVCVWDLDRGQLECTVPFRLPLARPSARASADAAFVVSMLYHSRTGRMLLGSKATHIFTLRAE